MAFWSNGTGDEPKRAYRWILDIGGIAAYTIKKVSKPSFTISESSHQFLNHTYYYPGRTEWSTVSFTLVDPVDPDMAAKLLTVIKESGYQPIDRDTIGNGQLATMNKKSALKAIGEPKIQQLDEKGEPVEIWTLHNAWIKDVKFGELDYSSDDMVELQVEMRYDYATHSSGFGVRAVTGI